MIIGDTNVGKTSILFRYVNGSFDKEMKMTCGAGFKTKEVSYNDKGDKIKLNIWDTAGQEKYDALTKMYFKGAEAALVVYDMTEENSFEKAKKWVSDLEEALEFEQVKALIYLVGNKSDMTDCQSVSTKDAIEYAK